MDERRSGRGEGGFGPGEIPFGGHHPVDVGEDLVDEPLPAGGGAGLGRIDIGRGGLLLS